MQVRSDITLKEEPKETIIRQKLPRRKLKTIDIRRRRQYDDQETKKRGM
jgi:hypothetical protein